MVANTPRGYPYMQGSDTPDLGYATQALAEAINADTQALSDFRAFIDVAGAGTPAGLFVKSGDVAVSTNASGDSNYTWPTPFPNQCYLAIVTDSSPSLGMVVIKQTPATTDRTRVTFRCYGSNGAILANVNMRVSVLAVGR